jgi:hypothetical protein
LGDESSGGAFGGFTDEVVAAGVVVELSCAQHVPDGGEEEWATAIVALLASLRTRRRAYWAER